MNFQYAVLHFVCIYVSVCVCVYAHAYACFFLFSLIKSLCPQSPGESVHIMLFLHSVVAGKYADKYMHIIFC